jgi:hypothetical protein
MGIIIFRRSAVAKAHTKCACVLKPVFTRTCYSAFDMFTSIAAWYDLWSAAGTMPICAQVLSHLHIVLNIVCCVKQTGMTFPDWVAPLDAMLPELATAIRYALAAAAIEDARVRPASAQKVKPGGKPAAKKPDPKAADKVKNSQFLQSPWTL